MVVVIKVILRKYVQITEPTYGRRHARSAYERSTDRNYISSTLRRYGALRVNDGGDPPSGTKTTALAGYVIGSDECRPIYGVRPINTVPVYRDRVRNVVRSGCFENRNVGRVRR